MRRPHFDGGGLSPGPVTGACTVQLSDGSLKEDVKRFVVEFSLRKVLVAEMAEKR